MNQELKNPKRTPVNAVAIIPARAGKQSIPYKNLQVLGGKTLLAWAIGAAFVAEKVDAVIVSTEDERTAEEAKKEGALVAPRPAEYAQPSSGDAGFYTHAVQWMEQEFGWKPEYLVNLRPTSPLRFPADIDAMLAHIEATGADGLKSVVPTPLHPYKMWQIEGEAKVGTSGKLVPVFDNEYRLWQACQVTVDANKNLQTQTLTSCVIKGKVGADGSKLYRTPDCSAYGATIVLPSNGGQYFCAEDLAKDAGFTKAPDCPAGIYTPPPATPTPSPTATPTK